MTIQKDKTRVILLGASFDTGNAGVSALAESSIKCILNRWPDAEITIIAGGEAVRKLGLDVGVRRVWLKEMPVKFSKNILRGNHFLVIIFYSVLSRVLPFKKARDFLLRRNEYYRTIARADIAVDITGGDSFSDIYGMRRFVLGFAYKLLAILCGKKLIMLPQTYGPFKRGITRAAARYVIKKASVVYSRDRVGVKYLRTLMGKFNCNGRIRFAPDVGFVLESGFPERLDVGALPMGERKDTIVAGVNISGLLFNGGYTRDNMFGLRADYSDLIVKIIETLMNKQGVVVLLVSHVFPPAGYEVESDPAACSSVFGRLNRRYKGRIFLANGSYSHKEVKYVIGLCDFFIGSRMHACIAAMSQGIPTVGIAYSGKFEGVFESVNMADCVADARFCDEKRIIEKVESVFSRRGQVQRSLGAVMPGVRKNILNIFRD